MICSIIYKSSLAKSPHAFFLHNLGIPTVDNERAGELPKILEDDQVEKPCEIEFHFVGVNSSGFADLLVLPI